MTSDKAPSPKPTATSSGKTTLGLSTNKDDVKSDAPVEATTSTVAAQPSARTAPPTKMEVATEIFARMHSSPGITRKAIIDQFVADAKLSKAGASTYYQLIKAKAR